MVAAAFCFKCLRERRSPHEDAWALSQPENDMSASDASVCRAAVPESGSYRQKGLAPSIELKYVPISSELAACWFKTLKIARTKCDYAR